MGRKKAKKSKSSHGGGHKRHTSSSQSEGGEPGTHVQASRPAPAPPQAPGAVASDPKMEASHPNVAQVLLKEESKQNVAQALSDTVSPLLTSAKERESPSPPRLTHRNINPRPKPVTGKRAQMQGQLNGLEAELAVVEDLQARMAAKLSALDANLADKTEEEERQHSGESEGATAALPSVTCSSSSPEKDEAGNSKTKKKKNKKSKQDKAHKQEENMKEAQQMREAALMQETPPEEDDEWQCTCPLLAVCQCMPDSQSIIFQEPEIPKEAQMELEFVSMETVMSGQTAEENQIKVCVIEEDEDEVQGNQIKQEIKGKEENKIDENKEKQGVLANEKEREFTAKEATREVISEEKGVKIFDEEKSDVNLGQSIEQKEAEMQKEIAMYLQREYTSMMSLCTAFGEEMRLVPNMLGEMNSTPKSSPLPTTPSATTGQFFSYADAVKASLKAECELQDCKSHLENAESTFQENKMAGQEVMVKDREKERESYVLKYMKTEFEPCVRKLEAEEAEIFYYEALQKARDRKETPQPSHTEKRQDIDLVSLKDSKKKESEDSKLVSLSMGVDYEQMNGLKHCVDAEIVHQEVMSESLKKPDQGSNDRKKKRTTSTSSGRSTKLSDSEQSAIHVARYLKEESARMECLHSAERAEVFYQEKLERDRKSGGHQGDAARMTAMLEAATMEVEYDRVEQEFLLQREQQRQQPWRWVRADTAPAYINVPETVLEPTSDTEEDGEIPASTMVQTDLAGLVFQCRDSCVQTEGHYVECCKCGEMSLPWDQQFAMRLQEEMAQRKTLENMVKLLEAEAADQRQRFYQQRKFADELENSITDKKAEATEAKLLAMEYKSRCQDLEQSLDTARSLNNPDERSLDIFQTSESDYAIEARINALRAKEPQGKVEELEAKLALSKSEVQSLLDNLSDQNKQEDLMPVSVHQQQLDQVETRCYQLQLKVTQLEAELAKVQNVRDVWGSNHEGSPAVQTGSLEMAFQSLGSSPHQSVYSLPPSVLSKTSTSDLPPLANVDLPPVTGLRTGPGPSCLSGLRGLGSTAPGADTGGLGPSLSELAGSAGIDCGTLSSGLLSGLSDLQAKSTPPVVAPLAMQEDMDSDDDVSWSSASEHLKDLSHSAGQSRASPAPGTPLSPCFHSSKPCLPHNNSLHGQSVILPTCMVMAQQQQQQQQMHSPAGPVSRVSPQRMSPVGLGSHASPGRAASGVSHHVSPGRAASAVSHHVSPGRAASGVSHHVSPHRMSPTGPMSLTHSMSACRSQANPHQLSHLTEGMMGVTATTDQTNSPPKAKASKKKNRTKKFPK